MRLKPLFLLLILSLTLSACVTSPPRPPFTAAQLAAATPLPGPLIRFWVKDDEPHYRLWAERLAADRRRAGIAAPPKVLALSGGSDKGAFGAGLLVGWTSRGDRPRFDVVTGVSTGALIAPFAFLGADQDQALTEIYTGIGARDIFRKRILHGLLGGSSFLDSKPLAGLIARYTTPALIERIAEQHRRGRRLLVMTTNLDAERGMIWDMGAIASSPAPGRIKLFRQVLLASASIPGAFPPVLIDVTGGGHPFSEMHVDGGAVSGFFVLPRALLARTPEADPAGGALYILYNGRLEPRLDVVRPRAFEIMSRALDTMLGETDRMSVEDLRAFAKRLRLGFAICSIAGDDLNPDARLFDTANMRKLYAIGRREAAAPNTCLIPSIQDEPGLAK